jgi:hypothetical protein
MRQSGFRRASTQVRFRSPSQICKWVRIDQAEDEFAADGDDDVEEGEEGDEADENDEAGEDGDEALAKDTPAPGPTEPATPMETDGEVTTAKITIAEPTPEITPTPAPLETPVDSPPRVPEELAAHELPSNAIEMSNTAPHSTEVGHGDLGQEAGVEITLPEQHSQAKPDTQEGKEAEGGEVGEDEGMEVDKEPLPPVRDEGLTMADNEPRREEFEIQGQDDPREVALPGE